MGVHRLLTYVLKNRKKCCEKVNLIEESARRGGNVELLCDFSTFMYWIHEQFWCSLISASTNHWLKIIGAEYESFDNYLVKFITMLKHLNVSLVFYVDGNVRDYKPKLNNWKTHFLRNLLIQRKILQSLGEHSIDFLTELAESGILPVIYELQCRETLHQLGCELIQLTNEETNAALINSFHRRPKAVAIFSNDSDFCIFENSRFVPNRLFDVENDLLLKDANPLSKKPKKLIIEFVSSEKVQEFLEVCCSIL